MSKLHFFSALDIYFLFSSITLHSQRPDIVFILGFTIFKYIYYYIHINIMHTTKSAALQQAAPRRLYRGYLPYFSLTSIRTRPNPTTPTVSSGGTYE